MEDDIFDEMEMEEREERRKFYKQANTAYQLARYKVVGDFFCEDVGLKLILIVLFTPLLLIMYIVYYVAYKIRDCWYERRRKKEESEYN